MKKKSMHSFVQIDYSPPKKKEVAERRSHFEEIYHPFSHEELTDQSSRCEQCGVPFCQNGCPLHNNIPDWLKLATEERFEEAYRLSSATSDFPEICGRICPQDRLCEGSCVLEVSGHQTVTIGSVESHITEKAWELGYIQPIAPSQERKELVSIIGSGPAGLSAAARLRAYGYQVEVYERNDRLGGLLIYGIPGFKLEKFVVERRINWLKESGVRFTVNTEVGKDISFSALREKSDAVLIATGVYQPHHLACPGIELGNIVPALPYLTVSNRLDLGDDIPSATLTDLHARGKKVVVIGGGDTAMDCVRTAIRQEAKSVTCLYRRDQKNMPGSAREVKNAQEEGVDFQWLTNPKAFMGDKNVSKLIASRMELSSSGVDGRQKVIPIAQSEHEISADMAILALGFVPEDLHAMLDEPHLQLQNWKTVQVQAASQATSLEGVFAAGDIVRGASLVVWAIKEGRNAALGIHQYIQNRSLQKVG